MKQRKYFQFFREWWEPLQNVNDTGIKCRLLEMIILYALDGKEPTKGDLSRLDDVGRMYWSTVFPQIKNSRKNFVNGCKSKGAPKGSRNAARFEIPSFDEVAEYFNASEFTSSPDGFFDYNEATGWEGCKRHFKDWKTAADRWEQRGGEYDE